MRSRKIFNFCSYTKYRKFAPYETFSLYSSMFNALLYTPCLCIIIIGFDLHQNWCNWQNAQLLLCGWQELVNWRRSQLLGWNWGSPAKDLYWNQDAEMLLLWRAIQPGEAVWLFFWMMTNGQQIFPAKWSSVSLFCNYTFTVGIFFKGADMK